MMLHQATKTGRLLSKNSRPQNAVYPGLLSAISAYVLHASIHVAVICYIEILLLYAIAAGFNNFHDLQTDTLNNRFDNPLVQKGLDNKELGVFFAACILVIGISQLRLAQPATLFITTSYLVLTLAYSHPRTNIKARGLLGTLLLCICYGTLPFLLGALQGDTLKTPEFLLLLVLETVLIMPLILAKDYKDSKGDILTRKYTPLILYGSRVIFYIALATALLAVTIYSWLAIQYSISIVVVIACSCIYLLLIYVLHTSKGTLAKSYRHVLVFALLTISLSLLKRF